MSIEQLGLLLKGGVFNMGHPLAPEHELLHEKERRIREEPTHSDIMEKLELIESLLREFEKRF
ncbi:Uncharacterised protein [uncultured archaeon]|nr:Uncharacterised protein [uncultured archaeon]